MRVDIDVTNVGVIPDGDYVGTVESFELRTSKKPDGGQYISWRFFVPDAGQSVFHITSLKPTALFGIKDLLDACGVEYDESGFDLDGCVGKEIGLRIIINEDPDYGTRNEVKKVYKV